MEKPSTGLKLSFLGELKSHHQFKQGTVYRQVRPTVEDSNHMGHGPVKCSVVGDGEGVGRGPEFGASVARLGSHPSR